MTDPNKHITEYLEYYCSMTSAPEFGVLLKGEWGSGKTWFINKLIDKNKEKFIYVSLYGITSFSEIEDEFFRQLHPRLASKGMRLTGKIFKGILRTSLKIDFDRDEKEIGSINSQIPDVNFPDYLTNIDNHILVFDDLERCKMDIENVMGYINHFVEHQGFKVIILANEEELSKRAKKSNIEYETIKEKLIGKTFQITSNLDSAIDDFISKVTHEKTKQFLSANTELISHIYSLSGLENLRILKQSLWDFERIYEVLPEKAIEKNEFLVKILSISLAFSLEVRAGTLSSDDILHLNLNWTSFENSRSESEATIPKTPQQNFIQKYQSIEPYRPLHAAKFWFEFFEKSTINSHSLDEYIDGIISFFDKSTPNWIRLWDFSDLTDEDFDETLKKVEAEFKQKSYRDIGVVKHVVGIFLLLSNEGLCSMDNDQILLMSKQYVDSLKSEGLLPEEQSGFEYDQSGYIGMGFQGRDLPEFGVFCDYLSEMSLKVKEENLPIKANDLIEIMKSDTSKFLRMIILSNSPDQVYWDTPIFKYSDPNKFVDCLSELPPKARRRTIGALVERYKLENRNSRRLLEELDWIKTVSNLLRTKVDQKKGTVSGTTLGWQLKLLEEMVRKLENTSNYSVH